MRTKASLNEQDYLHSFMSTMTQKSDTIINYVLAVYFLLGIGLSFKYDTFEIGVGVGTLNLLLYYSAKFFMKILNFTSTSYQLFWLFLWRSTFIRCTVCSKCILRYLLPAPF